MTRDLLPPVDGRAQPGTGPLPGRKATFAPLISSVEPCTVTRAAEALEELRAELDHADALITEQQDRIEMLEDLVRFLDAKVNAKEGAA